MTAMRDAERRKAPKGVDRPRIAPPIPARSDVAAVREEAVRLGIALMPWQEIAIRYATATGPKGLLFREVGIVAARQNGKTTLTQALIVHALRHGKQVMHIAQTRELPREMFRIIADALSNEPDLFPKRRGKIIWPRFGAGQEEIILTTGGRYRIAAKNNSARGWTNDLVIIDETREMESFDIISAAKPTLKATRGQMIYLSNAGSDKSVVLNALRARAGEDPDLAYLEWSAAPERSVDDVQGWAEANPAMGHLGDIYGDMVSDLRAARLEGTLAKFETEQLCRSVATMSAPLVDASAWASLATDELGTPRMAYAGIALDPQMTRASVALAWRLPDERVALRMLLEATGSPIDVDKLGKDVKDAILASRAFGVGYDPLTDAQLVRYLGKKVEPISGQKWANASARFAGAVGSATLAWTDADAVTDDLTWTTRKAHDESGSYQAVRADDDRPITAALAAIRAVWLASNPVQGVARVW